MSVNTEADHLVDVKALSENLIDRTIDTSCVWYVHVMFAAAPPGPASGSLCQHEGMEGRMYRRLPTQEGGTWAHR